MIISFTIKSYGVCRLYKITNQQKLHMQITEHAYCQHFKLHMWVQCAKKTTVHIQNWLRNAHTVKRGKGGERERERESQCLN